MVLREYHYLIVLERALKDNMARRDGLWFVLSKVAWRVHLACIANISDEYVTGCSIPGSE